MGLLIWISVASNAILLALLSAIWLEARAVRKVLQAREENKSTLNVLEKISATLNFINQDSSSLPKLSSETRQ